MAFRGHLASPDDSRSVTFRFAYLGSDVEPNRLHPRRNATLLLCV